MNPLDTLVRDLTKVHPRPKSEVREMVEAYVKVQVELAYEKGRLSVAKEMHHEQSKLLDGFAHPKTCPICKEEHRLITKFEEHYP